MCKQVISIFPAAGPFHALQLGIPTYMGCITYLKHCLSFVAIWRQGAKVKF